MIVICTHADECGEIDRCTHSTAHKFNDNDIDGDSYDETLDDCLTTCPDFPDAKCVEVKP